MSRWLLVVHCGLFACLAGTKAQAPWDFGPAAKIVGDPTGAFRKKLEGGWGKGNPKAPDRVELDFTWQHKGGGLKWEKHPAIGVNIFSKGEVIRHQFGPVYLEKNGKALLKWAGRIYKYRLKGKSIRLKQYTPPFQFDEEENPAGPEFYDLSGVWTKQREPQKRNTRKWQGDILH